MKPILREVTLLTLSSALILSTGCRGRNAHADELTVLPGPAPVTVVAAAPAPAAATPPIPPQATTAPAAITTSIPPGSIIITNSRPVPTASASVAPANVAAPQEAGAAEATVPPELQLSPALAEVVKLVQGGVGEDVLAAYITNSTEVFNIGSEEILYLHDLGVPSHLITALIQQDSTPEALARKQAAAPAAPQTVAAPATTTSPAPAVVYTVPAVQQPVVVNQFYNDLAPYGTWIDVAGHGRCWRPTVAIYNRSWRPYSDGGRWVWTDHGWYWSSDYSWGWAAFHYGRWTTHGTFGWMWVPDVHWGPAWVSWRSTSSHCAWAPLPPSSMFVIGVGWRFGGRHYRDDCDFIPRDRYVAIPTRHLHDARPVRHLVAGRQAEEVVRTSFDANNHATVNQRVINRGVGVDNIAKVSGHPIRPVSLRPGSDLPRNGVRREVLDTDARTLRVARPTSADTAVRTPPTARPGSSVSNPRPTTVRSGVRPTEPANSSPTIPTPHRPVTAQPPASRSTEITTTPPRGGRPVTPAIEAPSRPTTVARPASAPSTPAPVVRVPARIATPATRPESPRVHAPSQPSRAPVFNAPSSPAPSAAPRIAPPAAVHNSPRPSASPSPSPRVESSRSPSPAPSRSSESSPRVSRSSGDDGERRRSR